MKAKTYVTDLTLFEGIDDPSRDVPGPARRIGMYFRAITEQASSAAPGAVVNTGVACRRRPGRRPCPGRIVARRDADARIVWSCPHCGENGMIYNWVGTPWDRSGGVPAAAERPPEPVGPTKHAVAVALDTCIGAARAILDRLNEMSRDEVIFPDRDYGMIVRAITEGTAAYLRRNGTAEEIAAAANDELIAHAERLFVAEWLREATEVEVEGGLRANLAEEEAAARAVFDYAVRSPRTPWPPATTPTGWLH
jgi:hypothetical protein